MVKHKVPLVLLLVDVIFINFIFYLLNLKFDIEKYLFFSIYITLVYIIVMYSSKMFIKSKLVNLDIISKTLKMSLICLVTIAACAYIDWTFRLPRYMMLSMCTFNGIGIYILHSIYYSRYIERENCLIVGRKPGIGKFIQKYYDILGFVDDKNKEPLYYKPCLGDLKSIRNIVQKYKIKNIIFSLSYKYRSKILDIILSTYDLDIAFKTIPSLNRYVISNSSNSSNAYLSDIIIRPANPIYLFIKRLFDIVLSLLLIIVLGPILIIIGIIIKFDSEGSVFYKQERLGLWGKKFNLLKFRTMINNAESKTGPVIITHKTKDPRITKVGAFLRRTHLDELLQLFNIFNGNMTFVGPRPEREVFSIELDNRLDNWNKRLYIKPGLTGLAQVSCMGSLEPESKIEKDLYYLKNMSLLFDLKIVILTILKILKGE